ncbi:hypothetical protein DMENIID0001_083860 [Sergentomyia squamirostris]
MADSACSDKDSRWYFTTEQLQNSPSRKCGIDADKELVYRQQTAYLIQEMGQLLRVSQLCINTAIVYMHRFYAFHSFSQFNRHGIAAASLFLAAKVEEQPRKLEHIIRVAFTCLNMEAPDPSKESFAEQAQDLVFNENVLLQTLGFDVAIDHPHTHVVKTCHLVKATSSFAACKDLAQTSYFMASNSLHLTTMCLQYKPTVVACFCIHLACRWSNWDIPTSSEGLPWFHYVDKTVTLELLTQLTEEFIQIYDKSPSRLKNKLNSIKTLAQNAKTDERSSNHHRPSSSISSSSHHHGKQVVDPNNPKAMASSSRQQHYQQMHHQSSSKSRGLERPIGPLGDGNPLKNPVNKGAPVQGGSSSSSGHNRGLPPPRDAFARDSGKSRPPYPHHPTSGFPHKKPEYRDSSSSQAAVSGASKNPSHSSGFSYGGPGQNFPSGSQRFHQNSHKHPSDGFPGQKNSHLPESLRPMVEENSQSNNDNLEQNSPKPKSIFSPDQPEKVDVVMKKPGGEDYRKSTAPMPRFDDRRPDGIKKERVRTDNQPPSKPLPMNQQPQYPPSGMDKKVASVKRPVPPPEGMMSKHPPSYGPPPYKSSNSSAKRTFDDMSRHEDSGLDFREAKMRRSEAENESRMRKDSSMSSMNPLNLGGNFNPYDFEQSKSSHKVFPPSLANSIETNPDLVSCLLKESLNENKFALNTMAAGGSGGGQDVKPPVGMMIPNSLEQQSHVQTDVLPPPPTVTKIENPSPTPMMMMPQVKTDAGASFPTIDAELQHHKIKSEKKKKKEKHKHKEKDKSKDREERKKHKKDKDREKGGREDEHQQHKNLVTLKITLPKEKSDGPQDGSFKIKIPKDRIRADLNSAGHGGVGGGYDDRIGGSMLSSIDQLMPDKPSSSLKIKISKDKIEHFNDGPSFAGAFSANKHQKKDKEKDKLK